MRGLGEHHSQSVGVNQDEVSFKPSRIQLKPPFKTIRKLKKIKLKTQAGANFDVTYTHVGMIKVTLHLHHQTPDEGMFSPHSLPIFLFPHDNKSG